MDEETRQVENLIMWMSDQWTDSIRAGRRMVKYAFFLGVILGLLIGWRFL